MKLTLIYKLGLWLGLTSFSMVLQDIALFLQTTKAHINDTLIEKIIANEFWATLMWCVAIPAMRIGVSIMNPIKLTIASYLFLFGSQIITNTFWLKIPTTVDDYASIVIVVFGLLISAYKVFG
jgi:uncharacterized protein (DUF486 family)